MKPVSKKAMAEVRRFTRRHGDPEQRTPWSFIASSLECLKHNTLNHLRVMDESTDQHRDRIAELQRLEGALKALSHDTKAIITEFAGFAAMAVRGVPMWSHDGRDVDALTAAVDMALKAVDGKRQARGGGHESTVRQMFVRDAAAVYLMAGFNTLSANDDSVFMKWLVMLDTVLRLGLATNGSFRRIVLDTIGKTQAERNAWKANRIRVITRN